MSLTPAEIAEIEKRNSPEHSWNAAGEVAALVAELRASLIDHEYLVDQRNELWRERDALRAALADMLLRDDCEGHLHRLNADYEDADPDQPANFCSECESMWPCYVERARSLVVEDSA